MKIGTSNTMYAPELPMGEGMARIRAAGFDCVDLNLYIFSTPGQPMAEPGWRAWVESVGEATRNAGLEMGQVHALFNKLTTPDLAYQGPEEVFFHSLEACRLLGCRELVFHPVFYPGRVESAQLRGELTDYNARWFRELVPAAVEQGVYLDIENTFDYAKVQLPGDPATPFTAAADMLDLLARIGSSQCALCLDTGHAHIAAQDIPGMVLAFGERLRVLHLNDNFGAISPIYSDIHTFPGFGSADFPGIFAALRQTGYAGVLNIEPGGFLNQMPLPVRDAAMRCGAAVTRRYGEQAGL